MLAARLPGAAQVFVEVAALTAGEAARGPAPGKGAHLGLIITGQVSDMMNSNPRRIRCTASKCLLLPRVPVLRKKSSLSKNE